MAVEPFEPVMKELRKYMFSTETVRIPTVLYQLDQVLTPDDDCVADFSVHIPHGADPALKDGAREYLYKSAGVWLATHKKIPWAWPDVEEDASDYAVFLRLRIPLVKT